jgi:hypothetical protein
LIGCKKAQNSKNTALCKHFPLFLRPYHHAVVAPAHFFAALTPQKKLDLHLIFPIIFIVL